MPLISPKAEPLSRRQLLCAALAAGASACLPAAAFAAGQEPLETDVLVVGSGLAGLTAALSASLAGARVLVAEQSEVAGGNSALASGFINCAADSRDTAAIERHVVQTWKDGGHLGKLSQIRTMCRLAPQIYAWYRSLGVPFSEGIHHVYGSPSPLAHQSAGGSGGDYLAVLGRELERRSVPVCTGWKMVRLVRTPGGPILGAELQAPHGAQAVRALRGVILAAGGFAGNAAMCRQLDPRLAGVDTHTRSDIRGEAMLAAVAAGAALTDMDFIQCSPGSQPGATERIALHLLADSFVWVNQHGERFVDENAPRNQIRDAFFLQPRGEAQAVVDSAGFSRLDARQRHAAAEGLRSGVVLKADSIENLARAAQIPAEAMAATLRRYNEAVRAGARDQFGSCAGRQTISRPPFYCVPNRMSIHTTLGGLDTGDDARVLGLDGKPIPALFAAGEITGGLHGVDSLTGNGFAQAGVFGRIAGENAAARRSQGEQP